MPFGIRPSNVRVCHFTTRAGERGICAALKLSRNAGKQETAALHCPEPLDVAGWTFDVGQMSDSDWIKLDLHTHTLDDPVDALDYSAHQLLERAKALGFAVLAITLHDAVFDRADVFADAASMGVLLIPAAELRIRGADVILLNVTADEIIGINDFDDLRRLREQRGDSLFTIVPHPFYITGGSMGGKRLVQEIDCFDAIELCHFHRGLFDRNRPARKIAERFGKPLIATSDAHRLHAFGSHYTSMPRPETLTAESVIAGLRHGCD
jgi:predicted metal-dependent phosphoesterase TrpH